MNLSHTVADAARGAIESTASTLDDAEAMARRAAVTIGERSHRWKDGALDATSHAVAHTRQRPMQTALIAVAVAGAAIALGAWLRRRRYG